MPHRQLHTELESMQQPISHRHEKRDPKANQQLPQKTVNSRKKSAASTASSAAPLHSPEVTAQQHGSSGFAFHGNSAARGSERRMKRYYPQQSLVRVLGLPGPASTPTHFMCPIPSGPNPVAAENTCG